MSTPTLTIPPTGSTRTAALAPGRIGSEEFHSGPLAPVHEAAILYAADFPAHAEAILRVETNAPTRAGKQAWLMLFDLLEMTRNQAGHEALAQRFAAHFQQEPPAWNGGADSVPDPRRAQNRERRDYFVLKPTALGELGPEIERFVAFAQSLGSARLDLGKIAAITGEEAAALTAALQRLRRARLPMWFNGAQALEGILRSALNERAVGATRDFWQLLFELCMLQGKQDLFEELALEYAVALEAAAPAWEAYENPIAVAAAARNGAAAESGVVLRGVVSAASQGQLAEIAERCSAGPEAVIDMGKVLRIDFSVGAQFFEAVKAIQLAGKRVILANLSELNAALLEAFGFNRHAILLRRNFR